MQCFIPDNFDIFLWTDHRYMDRWERLKWIRSDRYVRLNITAAWILNEKPSNAPGNLKIHLRSGNAPILCNPMLNLIGFSFASLSIDYKSFTWLKQGKMRLECSKGLKYPLNFFLIVNKAINWNKQKTKMEELNAFYSFRIFSIFNIILSENYYLLSCVLILHAC